ncbi:MAG: hypothetical protein R6U50_15055 [Desulfobacterales bacterium]
MRIRFFVAAVLSVCMAQIDVQEAGSCSVPVFRYALERWAPDAYYGMILFKDEMTKDERALYEQLEYNTKNDFPLNLKIQAVNTASVSKEKIEDVLKSDIPEKLPVITLWYPGSIGKTAPIFTKRFEPAIVDAISHSPKREELAKRLISKDAAVWILLQSGNMEKDQQVESLLRKELDAAHIRLSKKPNPIIPGNQENTVSYDFSILHLSQADPLEHIFVKTLLGSESDLYEHRNKPIIMPVFGRGRLLGALFGEFITENNIQGAVSFMTGACSCEVKAMNPGIDLLMAAPWERAVIDYWENETIPELTGVMPETPGSENKAAGESHKNKKGSNLLLVYGSALIGILVVVGLISVIIMRRPGRSR